MAYNMPSRASQLLRQLSAADFYAQDLKLFLDTHPDDEKALELYREAVNLKKGRRYLSSSKTAIRNSQAISYRSTEDRTESLVRL